MSEFPVLWQSRPGDHGYPKPGEGRERNGVMMKEERKRRKRRKRKRRKTREIIAGVRSHPLGCHTGFPPLGSRTGFVYVCQFESSTEIKKTWVESRIFRENRVGLEF